MYFEVAVLAGGNSVAFHQRIIQPGGFEILVAVALQVDLAAEQADADDASFHVVIVVLIIVLGAGYGWNG